jgi:lipoprotein signal peptidase
MLLVLAGVLLERRLVQVSLVAYVVYAVPHFVFHLTTGHAFSLGDNLANMFTLGIAVLLPLILLALVGSGGEQTSRVKEG